MEQKKEQLRIIKQRTIDFLRQNSHGALYNGDGSKCTDWLAEELLEAGPYPGTLIYKDIDYDDLSPNAWRSFNHLDRLRAILVDEGPALFADSGRMDKLLALLRYWLQADPNSANWFHNQIGSPKYMGIIALLMGDQLPEDMRPGVMEIVSRGSLDQPPKERIHYTYRKHPTLWTGANLIWGAGVTMYHALLKQDVRLLEKAVRWAETALAYEEEGIQEDGAFRQHGPRWYSGGYGRSFLLEMLPFYLCLEGTSFCFAEEKTRILLTHFLDGLPHMQHRGYFDYGAVGRELAREGKLSADALGTVAQKMSQLPGMPRSEELLAFSRQILQGLPADGGVKYFESVAFLSGQKHGCHLSVRGSRPDLYGAEKTNGEGVLCYNMSYGTTTCCMASGKEYLDICPVWDYSAIPGTTAFCETDSELLQRGDWHITFREDSRCKAVTDGDIAVMCQKTCHDGIDLQAAYFLYDGCLICLGTGSAEVLDKRLFTTVEQCHAENGRWIAEGREAANGGLRYTNLDETTNLLLKTGPVTGSWQRNNLSASPAPVTENVFLLQIPQGEQIHYAYMISPADIRHEVQVLQNDTQAQIIRIDGKVTLAVAGEGFDLDRETSLCLEI